MIILEGPDGSGKTTLAKDICKLHDLMYVRPPAEVLSSSDGPQTERGLIEWWLREVNRLSERSYRRRVVYDRTTFISDPIYRLAHGGKPQGTVDEMARGLLRVIDFADLVIFCLPDFERTLESVHAEGRDKLALSDEVLYNIWWAYHNTYQLWKEVQYERVLLYHWRNRETVLNRVKEEVLRYGPE